MKSSLFFALATFLALQDVASIQWTSGPDNNAVLYACVHDTLSLPWNLVLDELGDVIETVHWYFSGRSSNRYLIAADTHESFVAMTAFEGTVAKMNNAGINISRVHVENSGNYTVEVKARTANDEIVTLWRSVSVHVTDGQLHASQLPVAEYDNQTEQYHVVLSCGTFAYPSQPPFQATWRTPTGQSLPSSSYHSNKFYLVLPNPVESGPYICQISSPKACLHGATSAQASHIVNKMEARLAILEARNNALEARSNAQEGEIVDLKSSNKTLKARVDNLQKTVSFHARLMSTQYDLPVNSALKFETVVTNVGGAYSPSTGRFVAPYSATYFFLATAEKYDSSRYVYISLMVENTEKDKCLTYSNYVYQSCSVQGVVHLDQRQEVWVRILNSDSYFWGQYTSFSGFMIHVDNTL